MSTTDPNPDLKSAALNAEHDFYDLLSLDPSASASAIRRAYRQTALKYHPDKIGASDPAALEKFHLLQIAYDVLSDPAIRELYDSARRAREARREREELVKGRRRDMVEELERREGAAAKRKRGDVEGEEAEVAFERELRRLAEDGRRRRMEREEELRREVEAERKAQEEGEDGGAGVRLAEDTQSKTPNEIQELDRSISLRFPLTTSIDKADLISRFSHFGPIEAAALREKKIKPEGEKHRRLYMTAIIVYQSVVGAHAAVSDFPALILREPERYGVFEAVGWAGGREPDCVPKTRSSQIVETEEKKGRSADVKPRFDPDHAPSLATNGNGTHVEKKAPTFGSFKGGKSSGGGGPSLDEVTMMRLKNAERRRMEEKIRREEAAAGIVDAAESV